MFIPSTPSDTPKSVLDTIGSEAPPSSAGRGMALALLQENSNVTRNVLPAGVKVTLPTQALVEKAAEGRSKQDENGPAAALPKFYNFCCGIEYQGQKPDPMFADRIAWVQICGDPKRINAKPPRVSLCSLTPLLDYINKKVPTPLNFLRYAYKDVVGGKPANGEVSYAAGIAQRENLAAMHKDERKANFGHDDRVAFGLQGLQARAQYAKLTKENAVNEVIGNHLPTNKLVQDSSKRTGMQPLYKNPEGVQGAAVASIKEHKTFQGQENKVSRSQGSGSAPTSYS